MIRGGGGLALKNKASNYTLVTNFSLAASSNISNASIS